MPSFPDPQGLYDPAFEHDACGVSFVVDIKGRRSHDIVEKGITALCNLEHRGASGAESNTGDGAGILIQTPDRFMREVVDFDLPLPGAYATGIAFLPNDTAAAAARASGMEKRADREGVSFAGWPPIPADASSLGSAAVAVEPSF